MNLNRIVLIGKALDKPASKTTGEGTAMATVTLQVERYTKQDGTTETDQIPVVAWQNQAEYLIKNCNMNDLVLVEGRVQVRTTQESSGQTNWITEVVAGAVRKISGDGIASKPSMSQNEAEPALDDVPF